jgi:organic radical activating enzyme
MEKLHGVDYSSHLESAKYASEEMWEIDEEIISAKQHVEELKAGKEQALKDNEFAKENGSKEVDINAFDRWIEESEDVIQQLNQLKSELADIGMRFMELNQKSADILKSHVSKTKPN